MNSQIKKAQSLFEQLQDGYGNPFYVVPEIGKLLVAGKAAIDGKADFSVLDQESNPEKKSSAEMEAAVQTAGYNASLTQALKQFLELRQGYSNANEIHARLAYIDSNAPEEYRIARQKLEEEMKKPTKQESYLKNLAKNPSSGVDAFNSSAPFLAGILKTGELKDPTDKENGQKGEKRKGSLPSK